MLGVAPILPFSHMLDIEFVRFIMKSTFGSFCTSYPQKLCKHIKSKANNW